MLKISPGQPEQQESENELDILENLLNRHIYLPRKQALSLKNVYINKN